MLKQASVTLYVFSRLSIAAWWFQWIKRPTTVYYHQICILTIEKSRRCFEFHGTGWHRVQGQASQSMSSTITLVLHLLHLHTWEFDTWYDVSHYRWDVLATTTLTQRWWSDQQVPILHWISQKSTSSKHSWQYVFHFILLYIYNSLLQ